MGGEGTEYQISNDPLVNDSYSCCFIENSAGKTIDNISPLVEGVDIEMIKKKEKLMHQSRHGTDNQGIPPDAGNQ